MYKTLRRIRIAVSLAFLAPVTFIVADSAFGMTHLGQWLTEVQFVPAVLGSAAVWIVLWVLVAISFGRVYCSSVCPLGTLQDIVAGAARRCQKGAHSRYRYSAPVDALRFPIPVIVAVCLFAGVLVVVETTDPFHIYKGIVQAIVHPLAIGFGGASIAMVILAVIVAVSWHKGRMLCNTVCPAGGFFGLLARQSVYTMVINTDKCIHCGKCEDVCKSECINLKDGVVDNSRCVMCMNCASVCPNDAIALQRGRHKLSTPMMQPTR